MTGPAPATAGKAVLDAGGLVLTEGVRVTVIGLAPGLLEGLAEEDVAFLLGVPGTSGEVDEILDGDVSVMLVESASLYHFIRSPGHLLRVVVADRPGIGLDHDG